MNKEISMVDKLLDENNTDPIVLFNEKNEETKFEQVAVIPLDEKLYAILKPITKIVGVSDDEALVFELVEIDDEDCLVICDNMDIVNKVFDEYYVLLRQEGIIE